jgi:hypothetical protein
VGQPSGVSCDRRSQAAVVSQVPSATRAEDVSKGTYFE